MTDIPQFRGPNFRKRVTLNTGSESQVQQNAKKECDVNQIMAKYMRTGLIDHVNRFQGDYGDFTQAPGDYHGAMNQVIGAEAMFMTLPSDIRARFANDPGAFLDFANNDENEDEMRELGLLPSILAAEQPPARESAPEASSTPAASPEDPAAPKPPEGGS